MSTASVGTRQAGAARTPARVLLARRGAVYLPAGAGAPASTPGVDLLEADLLDRGYLLSPPLRDALAGLAATDLVAAGSVLLADLDALLGADREHVPLFRGFPGSVPADTGAFFVDRLLTVLFQHPCQPCVLCGTAGSVDAVAPCAHLVCRTCFDGSDFSGCPVCHRRLDPDDPFLLPRPGRESLRQRLHLAPADSAPVRLRVLQRGADLPGDAAAESSALLARPTALRESDTEDLLSLLDAGGRATAARLPERIPGRETKAVVLCWLLDDPSAFDVTIPAACARLDSATDVLRLLAVRSGGDGGLIAAPRFGGVPRPLRRALLGVLDRLDPDSVLDDLFRHARLWVHAAERLHPFEQARAFPRAASAFAVLRGTVLDDTALAGLLTANAAPGVVREGGKLVYRSRRSRVEAALACGDVGAALALLADRPGELLRALDHLLRTAVEGGDAGVLAAVLAALPRAARHVSPAVLLSALGELRLRGGSSEQRVYFPKGGTAKCHVEADRRPVLPGEVVAEVTDALVGEALRRAGRLPQVDVAVVDETLRDLTVPFTERTAARALLTLPRGSTVPLPEGRRLRLFLHWMQQPDGERADLDLSLALFDEDWRHVGTCDYTYLRFDGTAAIHSGDLTSAPPPLGASEFVDLDFTALGAGQARHAAVVVFSYNDVPFEALAAAFAGFMTLPEDARERPTFDPRAVEQRFDLTGAARAMLLGLVDLGARRLRWLEISPGVTGTNHAVHNNRGMLESLGQALDGLFGSGARVSLGELATWHAAARAGRVLLRRADGTLERFDRRPAESPAEFARRVGAASDGDGPAATADAASADLQLLLRGDLPAPRGATVHALYPAGLDPAEVTLIGAADLAAALAPD